jgi:hypothetical protein
MKDFSIAGFIELMLNYSFGPPTISKSPSFSPSYQIFVHKNGDLIF